MKIKLHALIAFFLFLASVIHAQQGQLDESFGKYGIVLHSFDTSYLSYNEARTMAIQPDGKIVVGGRAAFKMVIARFEANGKLDEGFGDAGAVFIDYHWLSSGKINDFAIQPDGKILALVESYSLDPDLPSESGTSFLLRFNPDGTFDDAFGASDPNGQDGIVEIETGYDITSAKTMILQPNGVF